MKALAYRTNRATYAVTMAAFIAFVALMVATVGKPGPTEVIAAFVVIPRLHDIGRSGWWYLPILIGSVLIAVVAVQTGGLEAAQTALGAYAFLVLLLFAILALIPGQPKANKWGEPPEPGINWKKRKTAEEKYQEIF